ncbi:hypothetical protein ACFWP5_16925 [Streptomyces sp. NPDC058469]|uniref:hypothetical protein n=1 Tax=Streptomyces sp. NPDC058469 TaxID=3346514 RepID=UPI00365E95AE
MPALPTDLPAFATALADRLPGTWATSHAHIDNHDPSCLTNRVWDNGHVLSATGFDRTVEVVLLNGQDSQQLVVFERPVGRGNEFLVAPMEPTGFKIHQISGVDEPNGIVVPGDPQRAAADVARRVLPRYQAALEAVRHNADIQPEPPHRKPAPEPAQNLTLIWYPDGVVGAPYKSVPQDAYDVLYSCSFQYRPHEAAFALPASYSRAERALFLHAAVRLLTAQGIGVNFRHATPAAPTVTPARPLIPTAASAAQRR